MISFTRCGNLDLMREIFSNSLSTTAFSGFLNRRAFYTAIRTINTAVSGFWLKNLSTASTFIKKLT